MTSRSAAAGTPYLVPADRRWYRNLVIAKVVVGVLEAMDPRYPQPDEAAEQGAREAIEAAAASPSR